MKPISMLSTVASVIVSIWLTDVSHTGSMPAIAAPTTLPRAPMASARTMATTPTTTATASLAVMTRPRCGTRVKVVRPLRWLHSLVTERIAMIGRMTTIGNPTAEPKLS